MLSRKWDKTSIMALLSLPYRKCQKRKIKLDFEHSYCHLPTLKQCFEKTDNKEMRGEISFTRRNCSLLHGVASSFSPCRHNFKSHLHLKCSLIALTNSAAHPNDIKQSLHIRSFPPFTSFIPLYVCVRVLQQMVRTMGFSLQGHRRPESASAEEAVPAPKPRTIHLSWARYVPQVPRAEELG